uniref:Golgi associated, gamma adaptin ear containing, ARF binding protein 3a n=1 Tax=Cyprinus carpio TaxID=7962 RepID=A0A8C2IQB2_CYPCA
IMADPEGESLESWLNKATNPSNRQEEWEYIIGFCDQINKELEGPQISVRLLAHKIQSPQDWESLQALTVLEACMKNCGRRFHNEVGKFRFLNELIKIVSPKYLGDRVSERVKTKVIELLYSWSVALPDEAKIIEAYQMLKKQGIVAEDPVVPVDKTLVPSPKPKNPVFDNEEKSKRLAELLKSKKPEDLQEANRIIKNMVKEDEALQQKVSHRVSTLEEVNNSVKLLNEMLSHFKRDESTQEDKELLKDLYNDCDKLRTAVFRLATETDDDDSALGDILHASDDLSRVINSYKKIVEGQTIMIDIPGSTASERMYNFAVGCSLCGVFECSCLVECSFNVLITFFFFWCLNNPKRFQDLSNYCSENAIQFKFMFFICLGTTDRTSSEILIDLADLDSGTPSPLKNVLTSPQHPDSLPADLLTLTPLVGAQPSSSNTSSGSSSFQTSPPPSQLPSSFSLLDELGPLGKNGFICPVTAYDKDGVRVLLHFATDPPPGRPDVLVAVVSMLNTAPLLVKNVVLQVAVPKSMKVKLQPPSGTEMAPFNPFMPPSSITQIMLLANPLKEKVRMRYKLTFILGDRQVTESGEIVKFPPVERWGHL